jgi:aspartate aminotransferase
MSHISQRARLLADSETVAMATRAQELKVQGHDVIALAAGEPDFDTPDHVKEAGIQAIRDGYTRYTPAAGSAELRRAIATAFKRNNNLDYQPEQIVVTNGGKHALFNAMLAVFDEGDEAIVPAPYWVTYPEMVKLVGGKPVIIPTTHRTGFKISAEELEQAITPRTRLLVFNSPSNPTGSVYSRAELTSIADVLARYPHIYVLTDEIYEKLVYDKAEHISLASLDPALKERCLVVNGASKAYAMTGWRLGWLACNTEIAKAVNKIQAQTTHHPCSIAQQAAVAALNGPQDFINDWVREFDARRTLVADRLNRMPGLTCTMPQGAFYVFPRMAEYMGKRHGGTTINSSGDFCAYLLDKAHVAVVPGAAFGAEGYFRISYAASRQDLATAMERIEQALGKLN